MECLRASRSLVLLCVVACKDNGKVDGCSDGCIAGSGGYKVGVGVWVLVLFGDE